MRKCGFSKTLDVKKIKCFTVYHFVLFSSFLNYPQDIFFSIRSECIEKNLIWSYVYVPLVLGFVRNEYIPCCIRLQHLLLFYKLIKLKTQALNILHAKTKQLCMDGQFLISHSCSTFDFNLLLVLDHMIKNAECFSA